MQAIFTKTLPVTNLKPQRIKVITASGQSLTVSMGDGSRFLEEVSWNAVRALCQKLNWRGALVRGDTQDGFVYVFLPLDLSLKVDECPRGGIYTV